MGLAKLDDAEYARRARERNNRVNAAHRQRLLEAGKAQTNVWLPVALRAQLDATAALRNQNLSELITALLTAALDTTTTPRASNDAAATVDMFSKPETAPMDDTGRVEPDTTSRVIQSDKGALMNEVHALLESGLSGGEIARRWNAAGRRTASGTEFVGANLLRDYRKWQQRNEK